jgi:hydrogenase expression/formation protein HypD
VVAGFEPLDLLQGVTMLVEQKIAALSAVENQYRRVVPDAGNELAQRPLPRCSALKATASGAVWG